jgi:hypothetical protein
MENIEKLVKYDVTELALQSYREEFLPLIIKGLDDEEGYEKVKQAWLFIRGERVNVEKRRVELKAQSLEYGRAVDSEAKRITAAILEVEDHLTAEKKKIDDEVARIKFEREQREKLPARIKILVELGEIMSDEEHGRYTIELLKLDDSAFVELVNRLTAEKLERQRIAQEKKDEEQRQAQAKIDAEKRDIEQKRLDAEREERHKAEVEQAKKDAAENAKIHAEIEAKRKEDNRIATENAARLEAERIEAERPDTEKLKSFAAFLDGSLVFPDVTSAKAKAKVAKVKKLIGEIVAELRG